MTVKDLLPFLPTFSDGSGYDISVRYKTGHPTAYTYALVTRLNDYYPFNGWNDILDCEVEALRAGYHTDDSLQILLATTQFVVA